MNKMNKILRYFPLNKMLIYGNKISLFKVIGIYWGTSIGLSIVYSLTRWLPFVRNLTLRVSNLYSYYVLIGIILAIVQYLKKTEQEEINYVSLEDVKNLWGIDKVKKGLLIVAAVLCIIPTGSNKSYKPKVEDTVVQTDSKTENDTETSSTEQTDVETQDGQQEVVEETQPKENTYEVVLSEKMDYGEAVWKRIPEEIEPGVCLEYNSAMLNMTNCDRAFGNVVYIKDKAISLPIKASEFYQIMGEDKSDFNSSGREIHIEENLEDENAIYYKALCIGDKENLDDWYIYSIKVYVFDGYFNMTREPIDIIACKVVLPGGFIVNGNIDLTIHYGLNEEWERKWEEDEKDMHTIYKYSKEGYGTYRMYYHDYLVSQFVSYEIDFVREVF